MYHFTIALERYQYMHITYAQTFEEDNHFLENSYPPNYLSMRYQYKQLIAIYNEVTKIVD